MYNQNEFQSSVLDEVLDEVQPQFETQSRRTLYPTYSQILRGALTRESNYEIAANSIQRALRTQVKIRKNEAHLTPAEKAAFISAINTMISSGVFSRIANIHGIAHMMQYDMHGFMIMPDGTAMISPSGIQRFLSWHRAYLLIFERELQKINPQITVPYWQWSVNRRFPSWLTSLLPQNLRDDGGQLYSVSRNLGNSSGLPTQQNIRNLMTIMNYTSFTNPDPARATASLESYHNVVHAWVGGTMNDITHSPFDPIFWMHHAEIDRIWSIWQSRHPNQQPNLTGAKAIMTPWNFTFRNLALTRRCGYEYEENTI